MTKEDGYKWTYQTLVDEVFRKIDQAEGTHKLQQALLSNRKQEDQHFEQAYFQNWSVNYPYSDDVALLCEAEGFRVCNNDKGGGWTGPV